MVKVDFLNDSRVLDEVFERLLGSTGSTGNRPAATLPVDIVERDGILRITAAVPGLDPKDLDISIEKNVLTIRGESRSEASSENDKIYRKEIAFGSFCRSIRLPEGLDQEAVQAQFRNGTVCVMLPRLPEEKPKVVPISVQISENVPAITSGESTTGQAEA